MSAIIRLRKKQTKHSSIRHFQMIFSYNISPAVNARATPLSRRVFSFMWYSSISGSFFYVLLPDSGEFFISGQIRFSRKLFREEMLRTGAYGFDIFLRREYTVP